MVVCLLFAQQNVVAQSGEKPQYQEPMQVIPIMNRWIDEAHSRGNGLAQVDVVLPTQAAYSMNNRKNFLISEYRKMYDQRKAMLLVPQETFPQDLDADNQLDQHYGYNFLLGWRFGTWNLLFWNGFLQGFVDAQANKIKWAEADIVIEDKGLDATIEDLIGMALQQGYTEGWNVGKNGSSEFWPSPNPKTYEAVKSFLDGQDQGYKVIYDAFKNPKGQAPDPVEAWGMPWDRGLQIAGQEAAIADAQNGVADRSIGQNLNNQFWQNYASAYPNAVAKPHERRGFVDGKNDARAGNPNKFIDPNTTPLPLVYQLPLQDIAYWSGYLEGYTRSSQFASPVDFNDQEGQMQIDYMAALGEAAAMADMQAGLSDISSEVFERGDDPDTVYETEFYEYGYDEYSYPY